MKFSRSLATYALLLPFPFVHWVGDIASAGYTVLVLLVGILYRVAAGRVSRGTLVLSVLVPTHFVATLVLNQPVLGDLVDFSPTGYLKLYYQAALLFLVVVLVALLPRMTDVHVRRLLQFYFWVFLLSIVVEWFLVNVLGVSNSLMPAAREAHSYAAAFEGVYRPFGLTGSASVNGSMLVFAMWIMVLYVRPSRAGFILAITLLALLLNNSGQAYAAYFITVLLYLSGKQKPLPGFFVLAFGVLALFGVVYVGVLSKLSLEYVLDRTQDLRITILPDMDPWRIVLGGFSYYKNIFLTVEVYFLYAAERFGLLIVLGTWIFIWTQLPLRGRWLLYGALFLGCIHYGAILYIPLLVALTLVMSYRDELAARAEFERPRRRSRVQPRLQAQVWDANPPYSHGMDQR